MSAAATTDATRDRTESGMSQANAHRLRYRADIDGLRAVAVGLVVLYHGGVPFVAGGYVGVDVFFVISGFLITSGLVEQGLTGRVRLLAFYAGRMRRLLPLSTLTLVVTCALGLWLLPVTAATSLLADGRAALVYVANWRFADQAVAYSDTDVADGMLTHFWSLSIEEQYYFGWPLLVALAASVTTRVGWLSLRVIVGSMAAVVVAISLWLSITVTPDGARAYYLTHLRLWEIAAGAVVAMTVHRWPQRSRADSAIRLASLAVVVAAAVGYDASTPFPGVAAVVPVGATVLLLGLGGRGGSVDRIIGSSPLRYIGERSYALYLWHWPALGVAALLADRYRWPAPRWLVVVGALAVAMAVSVITHAFVENPVRRSPRLKRLTAGTLAVGVSCTLILALAVDPVQDRKLAASDAEWGDEPVTPAEATDDTVTALYHSCHQSLAAEFRALEWCTLGDPDSAVTIVLVGDSHAQHWAPAFDSAGQAEGWRVMLTTRSSCLPYRVDLFSARLSVMDENCRRWGEEVRNQLSDHSPVDLLVVGRALGYAESVRGASAEAPDLAEAEQLFAAGTAEFASAVSTSVARILVLEDTPWAPVLVPDCLDAVGPGRADLCDFPARDRPVEAPLIAGERAGFATDPNVPFEHVSLDELVCPDRVCAAVTRDGLITYRDMSHLTATFSRSLADGVAEVVQATMAG